ncbi:MAG: hypothetical protein KAT61_07835 [Gammaproteobacteria bacterium]|nr:hypothetical protein [Gammaproteobacteria bacterium]
MKRPPTDREILKLIYERYYNEFISFDGETSDRPHKIFIPIDCIAIAKELGVDEDIVFGRLYYHLEKKYGYTMDDGSHVHLFTMNFGKQHHVIHFPLLSSVLAEMEQSNFRFIAPIVISIIALIFSITGFVWSII